MALILLNLLVSVYQDSTQGISCLQIVHHDDDPCLGKIATGINLDIVILNVVCTWNFERSAQNEVCMISQMYINGWMWMYFDSVLILNTSLLDDLTVYMDIVSIVRKDDENLSQSIFV